jgi:hypothetical protein
MFGDVCTVGQWSRSNEKDRVGLRRVESPVNRKELL